jgi:hypothetical protein
MAPTEILDVACSNCTLDDCFKIIGLNSTIEEKSVHFLIHVTSSPPFTKSFVCYASHAAMTSIVRNKNTEIMAQIELIFARAEGNHLTAELCRSIFEPHVIALLEKGGSFKCHRLGHRVMETTLDIPPSTRNVVDSVAPRQMRNQLYVPKATAAIDAWIPGIGAFNISVLGNRTGDIEDGVTEDLAMLGRGANKLYWLLTPLSFQLFTKKSPEDIDQYAVRIPYPK